jgi:Ala-tRNA(Pro) deacylase
MPLNTEVRAYLDSKKVDYEIISHPRVFSTVEEAQALGIDADEIAKTLVIHITHLGNQALVVIPGGHKVSNTKIKELFGTKHARLALEDELARDYPQFELGAVPPFGDLIKLPVYIDSRLVAHDDVIFSGGTHTDSIKMSMHDFLNTVNGALVDVAEEKTAA